MCFILADSQLTGFFYDSFIHRACKYFNGGVAMKKITLSMDINDTDKNVKVCGGCDQPPTRNNWLYPCPRNLCYDASNQVLPRWRFSAAISVSTKTNEEERLTGGKTMLINAI